MLVTQDDKHVGVRASLPFRFAILGRAVAWLVIAFMIGWILNGLGHHFDRDGRPAGFGRGFLQRHQRHFNYTRRRWRTESYSSPETEPAPN